MQSRFKPQQLILLVIVALLALAGVGPWAPGQAPQVVPSAAAQAQSDCAAQIDIPAAECQALVAIYNSTNGPGWRVRFGWLQNNYPCTWATVICVNNHVDVLNMGGNLMQGVIPPEIANFTALRQLQLRDNPLSGPIPPELGALTSLQRLWLDHTQLSGPIPSEIGNLVNLQWLYTDHAHLSGPIPPALSNLVNLQVLTLSTNQLSGPIPAEIGTMTNLQRLELANNQLDGEIPPALANLTRLAGGSNSLDLTYNKLWTDNAALLAFLNTYQWLWYRSQTVAPTAVQVTATAADSVAVNWTPIVYTSDGGYYEISYATAVAGPFSVAGLTANKSSNTFTIAGLATNTTYYVKLRTFTPAHGDQQNDLWSDDSIVATATTPPAPGFSCNNVTEIPMAECQALLTLFNGTNGPGWSNQSGWAQTNTPCSWFGVTCYQGNVWTLDLHRNQLNGPLPAELGNLTKLGLLALNYNQLSGSIPAALGSLPDLYGLLLDTNQFSGEIPREIGNLTNLRALDLGVNQLTGPIPVGLGGLTQLTLIALHSNQLSGPIPNLSGLDQLNNLSLAGNRLSGNLPNWLGDLVEMNVLWLHSNQFCGAIPASLVNLVNLTGLNLSYNCLTADDPALLAFLAAQQADWTLTQTVAPTALQATGAALSSIDLTWQPIAYTGDGGYYEVSYATDAAGPFMVAGVTVNKSSNSFTISGLAANTTYALRVRTFTPAHGTQQNDLWSDYSGLVSATTLPNPAQPIIKIAVDAQPDSNFNFRFTGTLGNFRLDDANPDDGDAVVNSHSVTVNAGVYEVNQVASAPWYLDSVTCNPATNALIDLANGRVTITVANGDQVLCTFTNQRYTAIRSQLYHDVNGNGRRNPNEPGLPGWAVRLYDQQDALIATQVTDRQGRADFTQLRSGQYLVCEVLQAGWYSTQPGGNPPCYLVLLRSGQAAEVRFGNAVGVAAAGVPVEPESGVSIYLEPESDSEGEENDPVADEANSSETKQFLYLPLVER